jgi:hypothetical protein
MLTGHGNAVSLQVSRRDTALPCPHFGEGHILNNKFSSNTYMRPAIFSWQKIYPTYPTANGCGGYGVFM